MLCHVYLDHSHTWKIGTPFVFHLNIFLFFPHHTFSPTQTPQHQTQIPQQQRTWRWNGVGSRQVSRFFQLLLLDTIPLGLHCIEVLRQSEAESKLSFFFSLLKRFVLFVFFLGFWWISPIMYSTYLPIYLSIHPLCNNYTPTRSLKLSILGHVRWCLFIDDKKVLFQSFTSTVCHIFGTELPCHTTPILRMSTSKAPRNHRERHGHITWLCTQPTSMLCGEFFENRLFEHNRWTDLKENPHNPCWSGYNQKLIGSQLL